MNKKQWYIASIVFFICAFVCFAFAITWGNLVASPISSPLSSPALYVGEIATTTIHEALYTILVWIFFACAFISALCGLVED